MGVRQNVVRDADDAIRRFRQEVKATFAAAGELGVDHAKANGNYHDITGRLRSSNMFTASEDSLILANVAPYASDVESRGYDVLSGAFQAMKGLLEK